MLLGKIKIHEIAKKLNLTSKEVLEIANALKIEAKSHMSGVTEEEAKKIEENFTQKQNKEKKEKKNMPNKEDKKKEEKKEEKAPVIIRREVIIAQEESEKKEDSKKKEEKKNIGFVERKQNKDYNIVYREKRNKPMTVSELFGLKKKSLKKNRKPKVNL